MAAGASQLSTAPLKHAGRPFTSLSPDIEDLEGLGHPTGSAHLNSNAPHSAASAFMEQTHLNKYIWRVVLVAGLGNLLFGVDTGVISSVLGSIGSDLAGSPLTKSAQSLVVSATTLGALGSSVGAGYLADTFGRKPIIILAALLFILGSLEQAASQVLKELVVGRVIVGLAVGLASMVLPAYIAEVAPAAVRGQLITTLIVLITGGQVLAYLVGFAFFHIPHGWRWMLVASGVPAVIQLFLAFSLPESPRWLVRRGHSSEARLVLSRVHPGSSAAAIERRIQKIQQALDDEDEGTDGTRSLKLNSGFLESWYEKLWQDAPTRRALVVACGLQFFQQATGFNSLMYFSVPILQASGLPQPAGFAVFVAVANWLCTLVALRIIDKIGRRKILLFGSAAMAASLALVSILFIWVHFDYGDGSSQPQQANIWSYLALLAMIAFTSCYAMSLGNVPWLMQAEIFSFGVRAVAGAFATATCWLSNLLVSATFLHLVDAISPTLTFFLYCTSSMAAFLFTWALVPETSGLSLEECRALFEGPTALVGPDSPPMSASREQDLERQALVNSEEAEGEP